MYKKLFIYLAIAINVCGCHKKEPLKGTRENIDGVTYTELDVVNNDDYIELKTPINSNELTELFDNPQHFSNHHSLSQKPKVKWHKHLGSKPIVSNIIVLENNIYTVNGNGELCCLDKKNGTLQWKVKIVDLPEKCRFSGGISIYDNVIFIAGNNSEIIAFDLINKKIIWKKSLDAMAKGSPVYTNGKVIVSTADNRTFAVDAKSGSIIWVYSSGKEEVSSAILGTPAVYKDSVICVYSNGDVVSLKLSDGSVNWYDVLIPRSVIRSGGTSIFHISASPVIIGDKVLIANAFSNMVMFDAQTGMRLWSKDIGTLSQPAIVDNNWIFVLSDRDLLCMSTKDGKIKWKTNKLKEIQKKNKEFAKYPWYGPLIVNNQVWVFSETAVVLKFDISTGAYLGENYFHHVRNINAPVIVQGVMYALAAGKIYAIG